MKEERAPGAGGGDGGRRGGHASPAVPAAARARVLESGSEHVASEDAAQLLTRSPCAFGAATRRGLFFSLSSWKVQLV